MSASSFVGPGKPMAQPIKFMKRRKEFTLPPMLTSTSLPSMNATSSDAPTRPKRFRTKVLQYWDFEKIQNITTDEGNLTVVTKDIPGEGTIILDHIAPSSHAQNSLAVSSPIKSNEKHNKRSKDSHPAVQSLSSSKVSSMSSYSSVNKSLRFPKKRRLFSLSDAHLDKAPHTVNVEDLVSNGVEKSLIQSDEISKTKAATKEKKKENVVTKRDKKPNVATVEKKLNLSKNNEPVEQLGSTINRELKIMRNHSNQDFHDEKNGNRPEECVEERNEIPNTNKSMNADKENHLSANSIEKGSGALNTKSLHRSKRTCTKAKQSHNSEKDQRTAPDDDSSTADTEASPGEVTVTLGDVVPFTKVQQANVVAEDVPSTKVQLVDVVAGDVVPSTKVDHPSSDVQQDDEVAADVVPSSDVQQVAVVVRDVVPSSNMQQVDLVAGDVPSRDVQEVDVVAEDVVPSSNVQEVDVVAEDVVPSSNVQQANVVAASCQYKEDELNNQHLHTGVQSFSSSYASTSSDCSVDKRLRFSKKLEPIPEATIGPDQLPVSVKIGKKSCNESKNPALGTKVGGRVNSKFVSANEYQGLEEIDYSSNKSSEKVASNIKNQCIDKTEGADENMKAAREACISNVSERTGVQHDNSFIKHEKNKNEDSNPVDTGYSTDGESIPSTSNSGPATCRRPALSMAGSSLPFVPLLPDSFTGEGSTGSFTCAAGLSTDSGLCTYFLIITEGYIVFKTPSKMVFMVASGSGGLSQLNDNDVNTVSMLNAKSEVHADKGATLLIYKDDHCDSCVIVMLVYDGSDKQNDDLTEDE